MIKRFRTAFIFMSVCGNISANQKYNCETPMVGGAKDKIYIFNKDDVDTMTRDITNPLIIRSITMKAGKKGFYWEGPNNSVIASAKLVRKKYKPSYEQLVGLPLMDNTSALKKELQKSAYGKFIVIVENNFQVGDSIFEAYFVDRGGIIVKNERDINNADLEGGYDLNFGQEDTARESNLPSSFAVLSAGDEPAYSYSATKTALELLITADPVV